MGRATMETCRLLAVAVCLMAMAVSSSETGGLAPHEVQAAAAPKPPPSAHGSDGEGSTPGTTGKAAAEGKPEAKKGHVKKTAPKKADPKAAAPKAVAPKAAPPKKAEAPKKAATPKKAAATKKAAAKHGELGEGGSVDDLPLPWEKAQAPYHDWSAEALAVPRKVLDAPRIKQEKEEQSDDIKVTSAEVKTWRTGREGDELGMKVGMKELRTKNKLKELSVDREREAEERDNKAKATARAVIVQADFEVHEAKMKKEVAKAAAPPPAPADKAPAAANTDMADRALVKGKGLELDHLNDLANGIGGDDESQVELLDFEEDYTM